MAGNPKGSVLVVGGGIAGVQAALDLADSGFFVHLVERSPAIGGTMSQLDKTFPTNDCSACILSPKLVECGRHLNIELITLGEVKSIEGAPGRFMAEIVEHPRYVDPERCIACGTCAEKCPKKVEDPFNFGLNKRKAIYLRYPQAVPLKYAIDPKHCIRIQKPGKCGFCEKVCPAGAIRFDDAHRTRRIEVGSVILAPGFRPFDPSLLDFTGYGRLPDVVTSMEFERLLSPSGPCSGHMIRPSDGKEPRRIAWLQCVGSRDINRACHGYCSSVCCMYAIKQAVIAREHASGELETHIFFMDMRTHGKGFERYFQKAEEEGVRFHRARVHSVLPSTGGDSMVLRYVGETGGVLEAEFDLVVLSVGLEMEPETVRLIQEMGIFMDDDGFVSTASDLPLSTSRSGIFVCGAASGPKDIPQSVTEASGAAAEVQALLSRARWSETKTKEFPEERNVYAEPPRIGVFVCHCGINIAGVVDVKEVARYAASLPGVIFVQDNLFSCSQDTIQRMAETIKEQGLNRVVVASCTPRTHEPLFQETLREAGLNKFLFEMANIRDQDSWVHMDQPEKATEKAKDLVRMAVAKVAGHRPLPYNSVEVVRRALVVGGGMAGMTAALALADQGFPVVLVEKEERLGGNALGLVSTWRGEDAAEIVKKTIGAMEDHPLVEVELGATVAGVSGSMGRFKTTLSNGRSIEHGVAILATGALPYKPARGEFLYGLHPGVKLLNEVDDEIRSGGIGSPGQVVFIHCVGSRNPEHPYCSRVCCTHAIKQALHLKQNHPAIDIFMLYRDIRSYGPHERLYLEARKAGIIFVRYGEETPPAAELEGEGIKVTVQEPLLGRPLVLRPDLLVLANGVVPRPDAGPLAQFFKCAVDTDGFLLEAHMKLRPVDFSTEGVFLAGLCHYPKPLDESVAQAKAAAARAAIILSRERVPAESITAVVEPGKCTGCGVCQEVCPYHAISVGVGGKAEVDTGLCKGCGACVSGCRSDAVTLGNLGNQEIMAQIEAALWE